MNSGSFSQHGSTINPYFGPEKNRLTVRWLLLITAVAASVFAFASHLFRTSVPETVTSSWRSSAGGFVEVGVGDEVFTHLVVSLLPVEDVVLTRRSYLAFGERTRNILTVSGKNIRLTSNPVIIVVDRDGEVHSGPCPINREEIQRLIDELPSRRAASGCVQETQKFLRNYEERDWPQEIYKVLIAQ